MSFLGLVLNEAEERLKFLNFCRHRFGKTCGRNNNNNNNDDDDDDDDDGDDDDDNNNNNNSYVYWYRSSTCEYGSGKFVIRCYLRRHILHIPFRYQHQKQTLYALRLPSNQFMYFA